MITADAYFNQLFTSATEAHQKGELQKATSLYQQLINDIPSHPEPYHMLALIKAQQAEIDNSNSLFEKAIKLNPGNPIYRNNFAESLQKQGADQIAIDQLRLALDHDPDFFQAKHKLATILRKIFQYKESAQLYEEVLEQKPAFEPAYFQLGTLLLETGNFRSAKEKLNHAIKLNPHNVKAFNNLAIAHQEWSEYEEARTCFEKALELEPYYQDAIRNLALLNEKIGDIDEAKKYLFRLAKVLHDDVLINWKAEVLESSIFMSKKAINEYRLKLDQELVSIKSKKIKVDVDQLTRLDIHPPSVLIYHGLDDLPIKKAYASVFDKIPKVMLPTKKPNKPHVGFVVTGGHEGVFVKCMAGMLNNLSTNKLDITVVCSFPNGEKIVRPKISNAEIKFVNLPKSLANAVHLLTSLNFDFLYYWEVGTDSYNYFIPFFKPAKRQCTSWGWPITSGNPQMDYFLSGGGLDHPDDQSNYTEKLVIFDRLPIYYERIQLPSLNMSLSDFGIPENHNLYLCAQNLRKVHPDFDEIVLNILKNDQKALVVFLSDKQALITKRLQSRLKNNCADFADRIMMLDRQQADGYFNILNLADVILDTIYYNGGANTNCDAFALATPVVTMPTEFHRGRFTAAAYRQMGVTDMIADSIDEYVELAYRVANDSNFRNEISNKIKENSPKIFEDQKAVRELENFFLTTFESEVSHG